jgi:hypothetical protein
MEIGGVLEGTLEARRRGMKLYARRERHKVIRPWREKERE